MFDWSEFPALVVEAGAIVVGLGIAVAAALQILKEAIGFFGAHIPAELMSVVSAVLCGSATAWVLIQSGRPWPIAVLAALAALYSPKAAHDLMGWLKPGLKLKPGKVVPGLTQGPRSR